MGCGLVITVLGILIFAAVGAYFGHRLPIPAGVLIGTLVTVGAVSLGIELLGLPQLSIPAPFTWVLQILLGMMVGLRTDRESLRGGAHALIPASLLAVLLIFTTVIVALAVAPLTSTDIVTILFAAAPGGLTEMTLMSMNFGADVAAVTAVQLVRVLLTLAVIEFLLKRYVSKGKCESQEQDDNDVSTDEKVEPKEELKRFGMAAPWGILGGIGGVVSSVPAGGVIGALVSTAAFRLFTGRTVPVKKFRIGVQTLAGGAIGIEVSSSFFSELVRLAGAGALVIFAQMLLWLATSWLLVKMFRYDFPTSALASSPGGISGVVPAAGEAGADEVVVTFMHLVRLTAVVVIVPIVVVLMFGS